MILKKSMTLIVAILCLCLSAWTDTGSVLFLYTSDMHDYIKPGPDNLGGIPYVAGYVASMRKTRDDILLLDSGDVMEKGDMVSFATQSRIMYEAMGKIGYDAGAVGNHDLTYGMDHLKECSALSGMAHLCLNYSDENGNPYFPSSKVFDRNGTRVAVIGLTNLKGGRYLDLPECGKRLAAESARLKAEGAHLVVVVAHIGAGELEQLSAFAPEVDLLLGGHTHDLLREPRVVSGTGALIVMVGQYTRHVGYLDVTVDREKKRISDTDARLVAMAHETVAPDSELLAWIKAEEINHCPEAAEVVGKSKKVILANDMAKIAAEALKWYSRADAAFCHPAQIMRSSLPAGDIDNNLLFRTGGQRGSELVLAELTGAQIAGYLSGLFQERRGQTEWAGFEGELNFDREANAWRLAGNLDAAKRYKVVMPRLEWDTRFQGVAGESPVFKDLGEPAKLDFTFTRAVSAFVKKLTEQGKTLDAYLESLG